MKTLFIPTNVSHWRLSELSLSRQVFLGLARIGYTSLGDLHGLTLDDLAKLGIREAKSIREIWETVEAVRCGQSDLSDAPPSHHEQPREVRKPQTVADVSPPVTAEDASQAKPQDTSRHDHIDIPEEARNVSLADLSMSVRLRHILEFKQFRLLGDLQGIAFSEFFGIRNCGRKTVNEIREIVVALQQNHPNYKPNPTEALNAGPVRNGCFLIPTNVSDLNPFELPLSVRLERILRRENVLRLGGLNGVSVREFRHLQNCGKKTIEELVRLIERGIRGEFSISLDQKIDTRSFAELVDEYFGQARPKTREAVVLRYGGSASSLLTLEEIGKKQKVTRERIRQICVSFFEKMLRAFGTKMRRLSEELVLVNKNEHRPVEWADISFQNRPYAYQERFYSRVLKELFPSLSVAGVRVWNASRVFLAYAVEIKEIENSAEKSLGSYTVDRAHQEFSPRLDNVNLIEFGEILLQSGRLRILHKDGDDPVIYPKMLNRLSLLRGILSRSTKSLTSQRIYSEFRAVHKLHGFKHYPGFRRIHALLSEAPDIYYFGKSTFGLEKHLHVSRDRWPALAKEFELHLRQHERPASASEFLSVRAERRNELTAQELADILRHIGGFADLGRQLFALPEWKLSKREKIVDIIRQALTSASVPVSEEHLTEAVTQRRSAFIQTFTSFLEKIPEMFQYGGSYYGLTPPSEKVYEYLFGEEHFFEKVLQRRQPPIFVENLWCEFGFESTHAPIQRVHDASIAWKTIRLLSRQDGVEVFHTGWSIRRLLAGIIRSSSHPMSKHEVEWEIKERYAGVLAGLNEKRMRELLKHDPLFMEDADGNLMCSDSLERVVPQVDELSERAAEIVAKLNRVVPSEDILDRLQAEGFETKEITEDILAMLLRQSPYVKEVGHGWFQPTKN